MTSERRDSPAAAKGRYATVYCGCTVAGHHEDYDCWWEGDVPLTELPEEDDMATFDCPRCHCEGLRVKDHRV